MNVYDFDNTIYSGESTLQLFFFYLRRHPRLMNLMPKVVHGFARYKRGKVSKEELLARYVPLVERELLRIFDFEQDPVTFWDKHEIGVKPFYLMRRQADDLIISASPDFMIAEICRRLGVEHYLASEIDQTSGKVTQVCFRQNKPQLYKEHYGDTPIENFYTDSVKNDQPMIDLARNAFLVKGDTVIRIK